MAENLAGRRRPVVPTLGVSDAGKASEHARFFSPADHRTPDRRPSVRVLPGGYPTKRFSLPALRQQSCSVAASCRRASRAGAAACPPREGDCHAAAGPRDGRTYRGGNGFSPITSLSSGCQHHSHLAAHVGQYLPGGGRAARRSLARNDIARQQPGRLPPRRPRRGTPLRLPVRTEFESWHGWPGSSCLGFREPRDAGDRVTRCSSCREQRTADGTGYRCVGRHHRSEPLRWKRTGSPADGGRGKAHIEADDARRVGSLAAAADKSLIHFEPAQDQEHGRYSQGAL